MKKRISILLIIIFTKAFFAQNSELTFPLFDDSFEYYTMKQSDDLFFSAYKLGASMFTESYHSHELEEETSFIGKIQYFFPDITLMLLDSTLFIPITHEEAHRSILTFKGIGSISQPIFKFKTFTTGIAYVKGVSDNTLKELRDSDFPTFIRMHTAGNESDYCIVQKEFTDMVFDNCDYYFLNPLFYDMLFRDVSMVFYEASAYKNGISIAEEKNELKRDIVGDDVCGMIHHLFNPSAEYHRYYSSKDYSSAEKKFAKRIATKAFINYFPFIPLLLNKPVVKMNDNIKTAFNIGYCLAPFGDFLDEKVYLQIDDVLCSSLNLVFTARQYQNKNYWFPEFIIQCERFSPFDWLTLTAGADLWWQPENFSFTTDESFIGGSASLGCNIYPFKKDLNSKYDFGINLNVMYKTKGFMPEVMSLNEDFIFEAGIALKF